MGIDPTKYKLSVLGWYLIPSTVRQSRMCDRYDPGNNEVVEITLLNHDNFDLIQAQKFIHCSCDVFDAMSKQEYTKLNYYKTKIKTHPTNLDINKTFKSFKDIKGTQDIQQASKIACKRLLSGQQVVLLIVGSQGTGKSHLLNAIGNELFTNKIFARYELTAQFLDNLRIAINTDEGITGKMQWYQSFDVLILDDIGMEKPTDWVLDRLQVLIDTMMANGKSMMYATNLNYDDIASRLGLRLASRLWEKSDKHIRAVVTADDYRIKNAS